MADFAVTIDRENPWPGLASYEEAAQAYFSGRDAETAELVRRIGDEAVTVLFGKSGLGKSSLLKAGVFPVLRQRGFLPVLVRLQFAADAPDPIEQIAAALFAAFDAEQIEYPPRDAGETLWDYLHRAGLRFWTVKVRPIQPVLVLDQFEEVFTLGRSAPGMAEQLRERLADLAENRIPAALAARVDAGDALPSALDVHAQPYKLVCSLREDFLPDLEGWVAAMPSLRRNRMRLLPLQCEQALQAVWNDKTKHLVDAGLARRIVDYLASGAASTDGATRNAAVATVEPALLSLVCRGINEARKREGKPAFDDALFEAGKGRIVADFYRESLADQPDTLRAFIEDELVTDQGYRNSYSVDQAVASGKATREEIATLVGRRLLRIEQHLGAERVELTHDLLSVPVLARRKARTEARWAERARQTRRKWIVAAVGMVAVLAVLTLLLRDALRSRDDAERNLKAAEEARAKIFAAQTALAEQYEVLAIKNVEIERSAAAARESASAARAAEAKASAAGDQAALEAHRARIEAGRADEASRLARSRELAARAAAVMERDRELAVLLAREALHIADTPEARETLLDAALYVWPSTVLPAEPVGGRPRLVGLDATGSQLVAIAHKDRQARLSVWDLGTRAPTRPRWQRAFDQAAVGFATFAQRKERRLLLVARPEGVDQLDVQTGDAAAPQIPLPPGMRGEAPVQLAVSRDERWLAAALPSGAVLLHDLDAPGAGWETVTDKGAETISIADDGQRLAMAASIPSLHAEVMERDAAGKWVRRPVDLSACTTPRSVSTAASYAVATWNAQACSLSLAQGQRDNLVSLSGYSGVGIVDTVASAFGPAFIAILTNGDVAVGTGDPSSPASTDEIKGVHLQSAGNNLSTLSVNASGTRVAWVRNNEIRVVSLAGYKLLMAEYGAGMIQSTDGRRIVQAREVSTGAVVWMTPLSAVTEGREVMRPSWFRRFPRKPRFKVVGDAVVIAVPAESGRDLAISVHDVDSGDLRAGPFAAGSWELVGRDRGVLLVLPSRREGGPSETRYVRLSDSQVLGRWETSADRRVVASPAGTAVVVAQRMPPDADTVMAQAFVLRGDQLVPAGRVVELPAASLATFAIDDAATTMTEERLMQVTVAGASAPRSRRQTLRWPLQAGRDTSARDPAAATPPPAPAKPATPPTRAPASDEIASPSGRLVVRRLRQQDGTDTTVLARREGGAVVQGFGNRSVRGFHFSGDERWLAVADDKDIQVLDLQTLRPIMTWRNLEAQKERVEFVHGGSLLWVPRRKGTELLIPVDRRLLEGFTRWLVTRELTAAERCEHGLDPAQCSAAMPRPVKGEPATAGKPRTP